MDLVFKAPEKQLPFHPVRFLSNRTHEHCVYLCGEGIWIVGIATAPAGGLDVTGIALRAAAEVLRYDMQVCGWVVTVSPTLISLLIVRHQTIITL